MNRQQTLATAAATAAVGALATPQLRRRVATYASRLTSSLRGHHTVASRLEEFGAAARYRLRLACSEADLGYPPQRAVLAFFKKERQLELYVAGKQGELRWIDTMPILGASGDAGPKRREGDRQVPEGQYRAVGFNPNSRFHVSIKLDYPNATDCRIAALEGRGVPESADLGSDIFIHGGSSSVGCLAMGDRGAALLFTLLQDVGITNTEVLIAPHDLRHDRRCTHPGGDAWWLKYANLREKILALPQASTIASL